jgi:hypothetical protein
VLAPLGVGRGGNDAFGGADLTPLREARVPVVSLHQDGTRYFDFHHTANDTLDKVDRASLDQATAAFAAFAWCALHAEGVFGPAPEVEPSD